MSNLISINMNIINMKKKKLSFHIHVGEKGKE
jgi:hypothetical protein